MESPSNPFDGIFSLMLLLRRNSPKQDDCQRPHTSHGLPHRRSGSSSPPPEIPACRPGHPADSFIRTDRAMKRRSKWSWAGKPTDNAVVVVVEQQAQGLSKRDRRSRASVSWSTPQRDSYMNDRAHSRHTRAIDRKLPRIHEAELAHDDEDVHDAELERDGVHNPDDISAVKRTRALATLESDLPLRRNSEAYEAALVQAELPVDSRRGGWGEAWSPI